VVHSVNPAKRHYYLTNPPQTPLIPGWRILDLKERGKEEFTIPLSLWERVGVRGERLVVPNFRMPPLH
jgi:hypothetical protein